MPLSAPKKVNLGLTIPNFGPRNPNFGPNPRSLGSETPEFWGALPPGAVYVGPTLMVVAAEAGGGGFPHSGRGR